MKKSAGGLPLQASKSVFELGVSLASPVDILTRKTCAGWYYNRMISLEEGNNKGGK